MDYQMGVTVKDTTFIDLSKSQIKDLHDKIFGETILTEENMGMFVKLELAYIPFFLFIVIMVTAINMRWNITYLRMESLLEKAECAEDRKHKLEMAKIGHLNLYDRLIVYVMVWLLSLYLDFTLMASGIFAYPWISIPVVITVIYKKFKRLIMTNSLAGYNDEDILKRFDDILDGMIMKPLKEGLSDKIREFFK